MQDLGAQSQNGGLPASNLPAAGSTSGGNGSTIHTAPATESSSPGAIPLRLSPKRQFEEEEFRMQMTLKRTRLSVDERRSDISMVDADTPIDTLPSKRHKDNSHECELQYPQPPTQEYEDISAEVDARMQQHEARKEHERKQELGIVDKRKRESGDSFTVELSGSRHENGAEVGKKQVKKKKLKHSHGEDSVVNWEV